MPHPVFTEYWKGYDDDDDDDDNDDVTCRSTEK
jgi:hypothetical protein